DPIAGRLKSLDPKHSWSPPAESYLESVFAN
ncbi:MAG: hypothetical protein ACI89J_004309, partial [Hyphomicrobiaceae bacterium]